MAIKRRPGRPVKLANLPKEYDKSKYSEEALRNFSERDWLHNFSTRHYLRSNENLSRNEKQQRILEILRQPILKAPELPLRHKELAPVDWIDDDDIMWPNLGIFPLQIGELYYLESLLDEDSQKRGRSSYGISKRKVPDDGTQFLGLWKDVHVYDAIKKPSSRIPLIVDLDFEEKALVESFALLLKRLKKRKQIDKTKSLSQENLNWKSLIEEWIFYSVLPYMDLMLWGEFNQTKITDRSYVENLPGELDENQIRRTTQKKVAEVMSRSFLPTLRASIFYHKIKSAKCRESK